MKDKRGVDRGFCKECGESECAEYELPSDESKNECDYCSCPPVKHVKREATQNFPSSENQHVFESEKAAEPNLQGKFSDEKRKSSC